MSTKRLREPARDADDSSEHKVELPYIPRPTPDRSDEATQWLESLTKKAEDRDYWAQAPISVRMAEEFKRAGIKK